MSYSDLYLQRGPRVPVLLSAFLVGVLVFGVFTVFNYRPTPSQASHQEVSLITPVNLNNNQFGVFWQTTEKEAGWVLYGESENSLSNVAYDERDVGTTRNTYYNHYVNIKNLRENTKYYYKVVSDNKIIEDRDKKPFIISTPSKSSTVTDIKPAYGEVVASNGTPLENGIVLLSVEDSYPLLTVTKITGEFLISLQNIISKDTNSAKSLSQNDQVTIDIFNENKSRTKIKATISSINPLPRKIVLGDNYKFPTEEKVLSAETQITQAPKATTEVIFPKEDAVISTGKPLIKGTAAPNSVLTLTITSSVKKKTTYAVQVDNKGGWKLDLTTPLTEGKYTLTVEDKVAVVPFNRAFTIAKVGQQVLGESTISTPSGTLSPTTIPQATPTTYVYPTVAPTTYISPTIALYSPTPAPPVSGINILPLTAVSIGLLTIGLGIFLAF